MCASYAASSRSRLLFLLLLQLEVIGQEEEDGGAVNAVGATQRRHHQERSFPCGVPHGAVTPLRQGNLRQRCRPLHRRWSLLSPWSVVRHVLHLLLGPGGKLLAPWSAVRGVHLAGRVVRHRCQGRSDRLLLVSPPRSLLVVLACGPCLWSLWSLLSLFL